MSAKKKSAVPEPQAEAEPVELAAESAEVRSESPNAAPVEAQPARAASVSCGPLRLKQEGKGFGWQQSRLGAGPFADVGVSPGPHGFGGFAMLGQTCVAKSKATHPRPEQAAAELEENITAGLARARANAAAIVERAKARPGFPPEQRQLGQAEQDLVAFAERAGWE